MKKQIQGQMSFFGTSNVYVPPTPKTPPINKETNIDTCSNFDEDKSEKKKKGKGITKAELQELFHRAIKEVKDAGIPVIEESIAPTCRINTRAKSFWGRCHLNGRSKTYWIEVVEELLTVEETDIMNTLVHEILHTCKDCMNHGPTWKKYADIVNRKYGYNVKRTTSSEEKSIIKTDDDFKYVLECQKCGKKVRRHKMSNAISHPEQYKCVACGGKFKRIK